MRPFAIARQGNVIDSGYDMDLKVVLNGDLSFN